MDQAFGNTRPEHHTQGAVHRPSRYLVIIESEGAPVARLFLDNREEVAQFDASTEETAHMTRGLRAVHGATGPEWNEALSGHSPREREGAEVYTLDV